MKSIIIASNHSGGGKTELCDTSKDIMRRKNAKGITGNDKYDKLLRTLRLRKYF